MRPPALDPHQRCARLDVRLMHRRHRECVRENVRGLREASREITVLVKLLTLDVRMRHPLPLDHLATTRDQRIRSRVGMKQRRIRRERRLAVEEGRKLLVFDLDKSRSRLRSRKRLSGDDRDAVTDETDAIPGQDRPVLETAAEPCRADVCAREDAVHTWNRAGGEHVYALDQRMRIGAADEGCMQHPLTSEIGRVLRDAGDLLPALHSALGRAEDVGHEAAILPRQSVICLRSWSAFRWMTGWPNSPIRPAIFTSPSTRSSHPTAASASTISIVARTEPPRRASLASARSVAHRAASSRALTMSSPSRLRRTGPSWMGRLPP